MTALHALIALVRNDLVLYFSNRRALLVSIAAPILIAAFFGALFDPGSSKRPLRIPVAVVDQDASEISKKIVSGMKGDASFDIQELDEPAAVALVKQGKVRAALVLPQSFGDQAARALFRPASKPAITVYYDPSQGMTLAVVRGLLAQHVMESVSQAAFGGTLGGKLIDDARNEVNQSRELSDGEKRDLLSLFDSVQQLQQRTAHGSSECGAPSFEIPFVTREQEMTSGGDRKYNSYAHSFAGMGVQFILFMGIELRRGRAAGAPPGIVEAPARGPAFAPYAARDPHCQWCADRHHPSPAHLRRRHRRFRRAHRRQRHRFLSASPSPSPSSPRASAC